MQASPSWFLEPTPKRFRVYAGASNPTKMILSHFHLAAALALLGSLEEARAAVRTGLVLDPTFAIRRMRGRVSDDLTFRAGSKRVHDGVRMAGVPEE
jgi:hypothetical protein